MNRIFVPGKNGGWFNRSRFIPETLYQSLRNHPSWCKRNPIVYRVKKKPQIGTALKYISSGVGMLMLAFFLSSVPQAHAKGDSNVGIRSYWVDRSDPVEWGHSLPRSSSSCSCNAVGIVAPTPTFPDAGTTPVPYLIDISRFLDSYVWIFNFRSSMQSSWDLAVKDSKTILEARRDFNIFGHWITSMACLFIGLGVVGVPFAMLHGSIRSDKDMSV